MRLREFAKRFLDPREAVRIWRGSVGESTYVSLYEGKAGDIPESLGEACVKDVSAGYRKGSARPILIVEVKENGIQAAD